MLPVDLQLDLLGTPPASLAFLPGHWEWAIVGLIALLLFGGRLPRVARSVGDSIKEFKKGLSDVTGDMDLKDSINQSGNTNQQPQQRQFDSARTPAHAPVANSGEPDVQVTQQAAQPHPQTHPQTDPAN